MHVRDDAVLDAAACRIDTPRLELVGRVHGAGGYVRASGPGVFTRAAPHAAGLAEPARLMRVARTLPLPARAAAAAQPLALAWLWAGLATSGIGDQIFLVALSWIAVQAAGHARRLPDRAAAGFGAGGGDAGRALGGPGAAATADDRGRSRARGGAVRAAGGPGCWRGARRPGAWCWRCWRWPRARRCSARRCRRLLPPLAGDPCAAAGRRNGLLETTDRIAPAGRAGTDRRARGAAAIGPLRDVRHRHVPGLGAGGRGDGVAAPVAATRGTAAPVVPGQHGARLPGDARQAGAGLLAHCRRSRHRHLVRPSCSWPCRCCSQDPDVRASRGFGLGDGQLRQHQPAGRPADSAARRCRGGRGGWCSRPTWCWGAVWHCSACAALLLPQRWVLAGMCAGAALAAVGGPMSDIPVAVLRQTRLAATDQAAAMRATLVMWNLGTLVALAGSPALFATIGVAPAVIRRQRVHLRLWRAGPRPALANRDVSLSTA